jgi:hypothetical protein
MSTALQIADIDGELGVILPDEIAAQLGTATEIIAKLEGRTLFIPVPNVLDDKS